MALLAAGWLAYELWRLLFFTGFMGAVDLLGRYRELHDWFAGEPVYREHPLATYPPATYVILRPVLGWLSETQSRWLWAGLSLLALVEMIWLLLRESGARGPRARAFIALLPLATYATGATLGNGQLGILVLAALLTGSLLARGSPHRPYALSAAALLILIAFVKPSLAVPFFWILLFVPGTPGPAVATALGYLALTLIAAQSQPESLPMLLSEWLQRSAAFAGDSGGGANLHAWLAAVGLRAWMPAASLLLLGVLGGWVFVHRRVDLWLLLGVTAFVTHFWTYHQWYDDVILLLPLIALYRLATVRGGGHVPTRAATLLGLSVCALLAPGGLYTLPPPWNEVYLGAQAVLWATVLAFLVSVAWAERSIIRQRDAASAEHAPRIALAGA